MKRHSQEGMCAFVHAQSLLLETNRFPEHWMLSTSAMKAHIHLDCK